MVSFFTFLFRLGLVFALGAISFLAVIHIESQAVVSHQDKLNHFLAFLVLAFLMDYAWPNRRFGLEEMLILSSYGVAIEIIQSFIPFRDFSFLDMIADVLGIYFYLLIMPAVNKLPILHKLKEL